MARLRFCKVCMNEKRECIDYLLWRGATPMQVAEKFIYYFDLPIYSLYNKIRNHFKRKHPPSLLYPMPYGDKKDNISLSNDWELEMKVKRS